MKKIYSIVFICVWVFSLLTVPVSASSKDDISKSSFSEMEYIYYLKSASDKELLKSGISYSDINEIRSFSLESAVLERKALSDESLLGMGYTPAQIEILRAYDGSEITPDSAIMATSPTLSGSVSYISTPSSYAIRFQYSWSWSSLPFFARTDYMAVTWNAIAPSGYSTNASASNISCRASYYSTSTGAYKYYSSLSSSALDSFNGRKASYSEQVAVEEMSDGTTYVYAKTGLMAMTLTSDGTNQISMIKVCGAVGHQIISCSVSVNIGADGLSISYTPAASVQTLGKKIYKITSSGTCTSL